MADLHRAKALAESMTWTEVGKVMGAHPSTIMTLLRRQGMNPDISKRPPPEPKHASLIRRAIAIRNTEHKSWGIIAEKSTGHSVIPDRVTAAPHSGPRAPGTARRSA